MAVRASVLLEKTAAARLTGGAELITCSRRCRDCTTEVDADGTTYRVYDTDIVENEFASAAGNGMVSSAWGDTLVSEVIDWLLLQRIRYDVILPALRTRNLQTSLRRLNCGRGRTTTPISRPMSHL